MIEITFSESASGSMKLAKGIKNIAGSSTAVFFHSENGEQISPEELAREQARVEEEYRKKKENAVQVEGTPCDVVCFPLNLSIGDISEPFSDERAEYLQSTVMVGGPDFARIGAELMETARRSLERIRDSGEPVRIWVSHNPDDFCGFCHILTCLPENADIRVVELPGYEVRGNELRTYSGWGEVDPFELGRFQALERPLSRQERRYFTGLWRSLQAENSPLRAAVNGRLLSVGADFYDGLILAQIDHQPPEFHEGCLIGEFLGRNPLGLGDSLVALRIEEFISQGMLTPTTAPLPDRPIYHRWLRKTN